MERRYVHQWQVANRGCDDETRHWTEIKLTMDELLTMVGCAPGSNLISLHIDRMGFIVTLTADEHLEAPCPLEFADGSSDTSPTVQLASSTPSSSPT